jgi:hypothetical protein
MLRIGRWSALLLILADNITSIASLFGNASDFATALVAVVGLGY